jgi:hypothetical protein
VSLPGERRIIEAGALAEGLAVEPGQLQPARPILRRVADFEQGLAQEILRALQLRRDCRRRHGKQRRGEHARAGESRARILGQADGRGPIGLQLHEVADRRHHAHLDPGMRSLEARQPWNQPAHGEGRPDRDGDRRPARPPLQAGDRGFEAAERIAKPGRQRAARFGHGQGVGAALEEVLAEPELDLAHQAADRGLGHVELARGQREAPQPQGSLDSAQPFEAREVHGAG